MTTLTVKVVVKSSSAGGRLPTRPDLIVDAAAATGRLATRRTTFCVGAKFAFGRPRI